MNAIIRDKTFYENSVDKKILELQNNSTNFNVEEFLIQKFKQKIKSILEAEILWFNKEAIEQSKNHFYWCFERIFKNYDLPEVYKNKDKYTKELFPIISKQSEKYTYVWDPNDIPDKIIQMKNKIKSVEKEYWLKSNPKKVRFIFDKIIKKIINIKLQK